MLKAHESHKVTHGDSARTTDVSTPRAVLLWCRLCEGLDNSTFEKQESEG